MCMYVCVRIFETLCVWILCAGLLAAIVAFTWAILALAL